jgi:hypothetical protein
VDTKAITDFVGSVGVPGAILLILAWAGKQLVPSLVKVFEGITSSLAKIEVTLSDMRNEIKELNARLHPSS